MRVAVSLKQGPSIQSYEGRNPGSLSYQVGVPSQRSCLPDRKENLDCGPGDWTEEPWPKGSEWPNDHVTIPGQVQNKVIIQVREKDGQHVSAPQ